MEAFTDFQPSSTERKTSITTYLEGEIIDFKTHSLETFNFHSNIKDDANNWRRLEPFSRLSDDQLVKSLVSKKFMKNLTDNWIFMRWKGEPKILVHQSVKLTTSRKMLHNPPNLTRSWRPNHRWLLLPFPPSLGRPNPRLLLRPPKSTIPRTEPEATKANVPNLCISINLLSLSHSSVFSNYMEGVIELIVLPLLYPSGPLGFGLFLL